MTLETFEFISGSPDAIKKINESKYLAIVITNQAIIAMGRATFKDLQNIHQRMNSLLKLNDAYLDHIYFCPHYPTSGWEGEILELKIDCECRKPKPGLFFQAQKEFNIDLSESYFIGDTTTDILAGKQAGVKSVLVETGYGGRDKKHNVSSDFTAQNICKAVEKILSGEYS